MDKRTEVAAEGNEDNLRGKKNKGYSHLDRGSSEEELVSTKGTGKIKKGPKMFGKLHSGTKGKEKKRHHSPSSSKGKSHLRSKGSFSQPTRPIFGVPLSEALRNSRSHDGVPIPAVIRLAIDYVEEKGLTTEGIYRISPPKTKLDELIELAESGGNIRFTDPHCAASFLKLFLRKLPEHILTAEYEHQFEKAAEECRCTTQYCRCLMGDRISALLKRIPPPNYHLIAYMFMHMQNVIKREEYNKMSLQNVGVVLLATLSMNQRLLTIFLRNTRVKQKQATCLFPELSLKKYVSPLRPPPERLSQNLPSSRKELEEELRKQQSLLDELHEEVASLTSHGTTDPAKEQELWEVQMVATQLRRKLKAIHQQESPTGDPPEEQGPCLELFEEKQLLAVQTELKERIVTERRRIEALEQEIREHRPSFHSDPEDRTADTNASTDSEEEVSDAEWKTKATELERTKDRLISEIIEERLRCAGLRAEIELITILNQNARTKKETTRL